MSLTLDDVVNQRNKDCGKNTMFYGSVLRYNPPRLPIGVFSVDYISGGGAPLHGSTCFWGGETGGKTYLAIKSMLSATLICWRCFNTIGFCTCSKNALVMKSSWIDIEGTLEREWVDACGPSSGNYVVTLADNAEEAIDCADASLQADDCGVVILDSLGALVPEREMSGDAESSNMGVGPSVVTRAVKKLKQRMIRERKRGHPCLVIFINQMRKKLNVVFGSNESQSGGHAMMHEFSLLFRCGAKSMGTDGADEKYYDTERKRKMASRHVCSIHKEKVFILARNAEYVILREGIPLFGLVRGCVDEIAYVIKYAKEFGLILDVGGSQKYRLPILSDEKFSTLKDIGNLLRGDVSVCYQLKINVIRAASEKIKDK